MTYGTPHTGIIWPGPYIHVFFNRPPGYLAGSETLIATSESHPAASASEALPAASETLPTFEATLIS